MPCVRAGDTSFPGVLLLLVVLLLLLPPLVSCAASHPVVSSPGKRCHCQIKATLLLILALLAPFVTTRYVVVYIIISGFH